jgi:hypothetical protein
MINKQWNNRSNSIFRKSKLSFTNIIWITIINLTFLGFSIWYYFAAAKKLEIANDNYSQHINYLKLKKTLSSTNDYNDNINNNNNNNIVTNAITNPIITSKPSTASLEELTSKCTDKEWCNVPMPSKSYYKFAPPADPIKWKIAQMQAANGEQILLQKVKDVFPHPYNFLDGDRSFRRLHYAIDLFIDDKRGFSQLIPSETLEKLPNKDDFKGVKKQVQSEEPLEVWEKAGKKVIPEPYDYRSAQRAPVVQMGYTAYNKDANSYFSGDRIGGVFIHRKEFFLQWDKAKNHIDTSFINICALNENWGIFSTAFPNRTAHWGSCCDNTKPEGKLIKSFLDHPKTLMMLINQHSNISHPKLLTIPRGLPLTWEHTERMVWDAIRFTLNNVKKKKLLFAATSKWGKRPQMISCISRKMSPDDFEGHDKTPKDASRSAKTDRRVYYQKLGSTRFGVSLPGLGYDCFRTWELLTMGAIPILERGVGFDRTLWRLPALLVEDFDEINPEMLHEAYVEALYRKDEFEFERLTQGFWSAVIANVSATKSTSTLLDKFPMEAELENFARPREPYACSNTNTCGPGTKRTPRRYC